MDNLSLVNYTFKGVQVRMQRDEHGEPLFCAKDVCDILGYTNARKAVQDHCDTSSNYDVTKRYVIDGLGREQETTFVTESGLYALIFGSKLPAAKEFKRWVTSEVLPSIRKTGKYESNQVPDLEQKLKLAKLLLEPAGIEGNQLTLALDKVYKANTGESLLAQTGVELVAPQPKQLLTPTQLGQSKGLSGIKVNKRLAELGYQVKTEAGWEPTALGLSKGAVMQDTGKKHGNGTPVRQLKWPSDLEI